MKQIKAERALALHSDNLSPSLTSSTNFLLSDHRDQTCNNEREREDAKHHALLRERPQVTLTASISQPSEPRDLLPLLPPFELQESSFQAPFSRPSAHFLQVTWETCVFVCFMNASLQNCATWAWDGILEICAKWLWSFCFSELLGIMNMLLFRIFRVTAKSIQYDSWLC